MDTRNEGKPSPTDEWGDEPLVEVMRKKHRIEGARLALEAAAKECDNVSDKAHRSYMDDDADRCAERIRALSPEDIVRGAEAKEVDR